MDKNIGKKLDGRYEITELIGVGGMADVYKATDILEDKVVAVKVLKNEFAESEEFLRRFRNESKAIAVLAHPNIVKIFDVGFSEKIQYIVMEYIDGITLNEYIEQQGVLKWKDAVHFTVQILRALQHAHDRGIVHRDIKPQNIMLLQDGTIKVMDFGIARFAREQGRTMSEKAIGSVHYISPEQARGDITDEKSDIYSVGVMLYEMLTGSKPFEADNPVSVALMHMQTKAKRPTEINNTIPEGLEEITVRAMQKDGAKRYQSAAEMIKDIDEFKRNPSIVFEYKYFSDEAATKYFDTVGKGTEPSMDKKGAIDEEEEYEEEEEEEHRSYFVPVLAAIATAFVIIAAAVIVWILVGSFEGEKPSEFALPNLVGMDYKEAQEKYKENFMIDVLTTEYSDLDEDKIFWQSLPEGRDVKPTQVVKVKVSKGKKMIEIPADVYNMSATEATNKLTNLGLNVVPKHRNDDTITKDFVISTIPAKGAMVESGTDVTILISDGPSTTEMPVPSVVGRTQKEAEELLKTYHLTSKATPVDSDKPAGEVIEQTIPAGQKVPTGTEVEIKVSTGVVPIASVPIEVPIPPYKHSRFVFSCLVNGVEQKTETLDISLATKWSIAPEGSGTATVVIKVKSVDLGSEAAYAEYHVDFTAKTATLVNIDETVFDNLLGGGYSYPSNSSNTSSTSSGYYPVTTGNSSTTHITE